MGTYYGKFGLNDQTEMNQNTRVKYQSQAIITSIETNVAKYLFKKIKNKTSVNSYKSNTFGSYIPTFVKTCDIQNQKHITFQIQKQKPGDIYALV